MAQVGNALSFKFASLIERIFKMRIFENAKCYNGDANYTCKNYGLYKDIIHISRRKDGSQYFE